MDRVRTTAPAVSEEDNPMTATAATLKGSEAKISDVTLRNSA